MLEKERMLGDEEERMNLGERESRECMQVHKNYYNVKRAIYMPEYSEPIIYPIFFILLFYKKKLYFTLLLNK